MNASEMRGDYEDNVIRSLTLNCSGAGAVCPVQDMTLEIVKLTLIGTFLLFVFLTSISLNSFVFLLFYKKFKSFTISNCFQLNLTACNCLTALIIIPFAFASLIYGEWIFGLVWCQVTGFVLNFVFAASTLTLVVISIDRYCAIVSPLHYRMKITRIRCYFMIGAVWVIAGIISIPPVVGWNKFEFRTHKMICTVKWDSDNKYDSYYNLFLVCICFALPLIVMVWVYSVIFRAAKLISQKTRRNSLVPRILEETNQSPTILDKRRRSSTAPILGRKFSVHKLGTLLWYRDEWRTAVTSIIVFLTFIGCWLPYFTVIILETVLRSDYQVPPFVQTMSIALALASSAMDPLVYVFRSHKSRQELREILLRKHAASSESIAKQYMTQEVYDPLKQRSSVQLLDEKCAPYFTR
ncbi:G-protein coupled receptor 161-like [Haliotis rubra]|uniref:G-protein coupled receptor 161-like n=1 Tax=Haliotis rubra TaxID=36100 RepID=UPI001EE5D821|nr:G-protein coupled receptor 161-like [Haliotis rubra]